jgi:hypothetical protein
MAIWQDLVSDYGFTRSYQGVKRYLHKRRGSQLPQATAMILAAPGEEAQVDYATGPTVRDPLPAASTDTALVRDDARL